MPNRQVFGKDYPTYFGNVVFWDILVRKTCELGLSHSYIAVSWTTIFAAMGSPWQSQKKNPTSKLPLGKERHQFSRVCTPFAQCLLLLPLNEEKARNVLQIEFWGVEKTVVHAFDTDIPDARFVYTRAILLLMKQQGGNLHRDSWTNGTSLWCCDVSFLHKVLRTANNLF